MGPWESDPWVFEETADYDAFIDELLDDREDITPSSRVGKFRQTSAGAVLNGVALGLRDVFDPGRPRGSTDHAGRLLGEPDRLRHVDADLDPDDPTASSVTVRPWLAPGPGEQPGDRRR